MGIEEKLMAEVLLMQQGGVAIFLVCVWYYVGVMVSVDVWRKCMAHLLILEASRGQDRYE